MNDVPKSTDQAAAQDPKLESGPVWKQRYRIEKEIGRGGFGIVYLAHDEQLLSKPVVIKVLQNSPCSDPYFQTKFQQEIEALARIDHPGVVGVLDVGDTPEHKPFLVMQFVEGVTLRSQIHAGGMDFNRVANIIRQVGHALGAAHDKGVFHRDLKPENIMLQRSGVSGEYVKLIDFGIASVGDSQVPGQIETSKAIGTPAYMAPEQILGKGSGASDIYAMGVIAYEMLTGQRPENSAEGVIVKPRELRPGIPAAAQDTIIAALSYQPERRPARPDDFGEQLARSLMSAPTASTQQVSSPATLEMAYVLFMDLVSYSTLPMDLQSERIQQLQEVVRSTPEYQRAQQADQIISLPTGDGMALVFSQNPMAPVQCAIEIFRALKNHPDLKLRMGVHTGPVYRIADINTNRNVAGGGINLAQRVMDCGDAGHILLSKTVADMLGQLSYWAQALHDLGEIEVKHGVKVHVVNFYNDEAGNPNIPEKVRKRNETPVAAGTRMQTPPTSMPVPARAAEAVGLRSGKGPLMIGGVSAAAIVVIVALLYGSRHTGAPASGSISPITPSASQPAKPSEVPALANTPPATPPPNRSAATPPPANPASAVVAPAAPRANRPSQGQPPDRTVSVPPEPVQQRPLVNAVSPQQNAPEQNAPNPGGRDDAGTSTSQAPLRTLRERMIQMAARANAVTRSMQRMEEQQNRAGLGMRPDMAAAKDSMTYLLQEAGNALMNGDGETAKRNLDLAERQIEKLEQFLGR